jgi:pimeloyl-ACP methyl ester carboxylesterase
MVPKNTEYLPANKWVVCVQSDLISLFFGMNSEAQKPKLITHPAITRRVAKQPVTLMFLHGLFGDLSNITDVAKQMPTDLHWKVPSLPLFDRAFSPISLLHLVEWVGEEVKKCAGDVVLIGNSLGGQIAALMASNKPEKIAGLVLTGSAGMGEMQFGATQPRRFDRNYVKSKASFTFYERLVPENLVDEIMKIISDRVQLSRLISWSRSSLQTNLSEICTKIHVPTMLIWGEDDQITPLICAQNFHHAIGGSKLVTIPRCGHAPMIERPDYFAHYLHDFLEEIGVIKPSEKAYLL